MRLANVENLYELVIDLDEAQISTIIDEITMQHFGFLCVEFQTNSIELSKQHFSHRDQFFKRIAEEKNIISVSDIRDARLVVADEQSFVRQICFEALKCNI